MRTARGFGAHQKYKCCAAKARLRITTAFLPYHMPRGDAFFDVCNAITAYSGKSLLAFYFLEEMLSSVFIGPN